MIGYPADRIPFAEPYLIFYRNIPPSDIHPCADVRPIISEIFEMVLHVLDGILHLFGIIDYGSHSDLLYEPVPASSLAVLPVIDIEKRIPSENEIGIGLLFQIRFDLAQTEPVVIDDFNPVPGQTVLPFLQDPRSAAGKRHQQQKACCRNPSETFHRLLKHHAKVSFYAVTSKF